MAHNDPATRHHLRVSQSSRPFSTAAVAASLAGLGLALAGCGGDDGADAKPTTPTFAKVPPGVAAKTVKAIDGDTLVVEINGKTETVRLLGIDAPESSKKKTGSKECGGTLARGAMRQLVKRSPEVTVSVDPTQAERDEFGRMLAYVTSADTKVANTWQGALLSSGWAEVYEQTGKPIMLDEEFKRQAADAKAAGSGIHEVCAGDFHKAL